MSVKVLFFASLKDRLGLEQEQLDTVQPLTVGQVWDKLTNQQDRQRVFCAINQEYAQFDDTVKDGDEVAFFPQVTGG